MAMAIVMTSFLYGLTYLYSGYSKSTDYANTAGRARPPKRFRVSVISRSCIHSPVVIVHALHAAMQRSCRYSMTLRNLFWAFFGYTVPEDTWEFDAGVAGPQGGQVCDARVM